MTTAVDPAAPAAAWQGRLRDWVGTWAGASGTSMAFPTWVRRAGAAYAAATVVLAGIAGTFVTDAPSYLILWAAVSSLLAYPILVTSVLAARRARPAGEHQFWRWLTVANLALVATGVGVIVVAHGDVLGLRALSLPVVIVVTLLYMRANTAIMRRRSGGRSIVLDAVETAIATTVLVGAVATLAGDRLLAQANLWWVLPCVVAMIGGVVGTVWAAVLHHRTPHDQRRTEALAVLLGVLSVIDAGAQLAQGVSDFTLPASPLLVSQQLTMAALFLITLNAPSRTVPGLERLSPQRQVRSSRGITIFAIAAVPVLGLLALATAGGGRSSWTLLHFATQCAILAVLLALRNLLALDETKRLYQQVEEAADERQRLLGALSRSLEDDRHRMAAQLHQQAIASYATFVSFIQTASRASPSGVAPLPETSERLQADLSRAAETWRELMFAVRPPETTTQGSAERLAVATRALVVGLVGDAPMPTVTTAVDELLHLDWATEALVLRIVQEGVTHAFDHWRVSRLHLAVSPAPEGIELELSATGNQSSEVAPGPDGSLATVRSFVDLGHGELTLQPSPTGMTIVASLGRLGPPPERAPRLRVV